MKLKNEKPQKITVMPKGPTQTAFGDETYRQINRASFQENFKILIGHFKNDGHLSRTSRMA